MTLVIIFMVINHENPVLGTLFVSILGLQAINRSQLGSIYGVILVTPSLIIFNEIKNNGQNRPETPLFTFIILGAPIFIIGAPKMNITVFTFYNIIVKLISFTIILENVNTNIGENLMLTFGYIIMIFGNFLENFKILIMSISNAFLALTLWNLGSNNNIMVIIILLFYIILSLFFVNFISFSRGFTDLIINTIFTFLWLGIPFNIWGFIKVLNIILQIFWISLLKIILLLISVILLSLKLIYIVFINLNYFKSLINISWFLIFIV